MEEILTFLTEVGKLKEIKRRGWVLRKVKNPETIASHTFRVAMMAWVLGKKKMLNVNKLIKLALVHDLCEVYAGDTTPYDPFLKNKKKIGEIIKKWPRFSKREKEKIFQKKYKKESLALEKIISKLPLSLKGEIKHLWQDYEKGLSREGRFLKQVDRVENLLQALEYWQKDKKFPIGPWWVQIEELVDDPLLMEFIKEMEKKFHKK